MVAPRSEPSDCIGSDPDTHFRSLVFCDSILNSSRDASAANGAHVVRQPFQADGQAGKPNVLGQYFLERDTIQYETSQGIRYQFI